MGFRVLVVDDASFVRDTIKRNLRPIIPDAEIHEAQNGRKAMSAMRTKQIQLILSDWEMPEMSGEDFLKWLRSEPEYNNIPFIMVTSRGDRDHVIAAVKAGVSDYLTKPFTPEELHKKVAKQLHRIGYKAPSRLASSRSTASSLDVLTGAKKAQIQKPREVRELSDFAKPADASKTKKASSKASASHFKGQAFLRFPQCQLPCAIRELSLQAMLAIIDRPETIPSVFEQVAIDLSDVEGKPLARLNGYLHAVVAVDPQPNSTKLRMTIRFVDNDPDKFEVLSKAIAGQT